MYKVAQYILPLLAVVALQLFIFDRLLISSTIAPLIYIIFIILLPLHTSQLKMLMWGIVVGVAFDVLMGMAGINSIATIFVSFVRGYILMLIMGDDLAQMDGIPTASRLRVGRFVLYIASMVLLHSAIIFTLEFMNFLNIDFLFRRILMSSAISTLFIYLLVGAFSHIVLPKN